MFANWTLNWQKVKHSNLSHGLNVSIDQRRRLPARVHRRRRQRDQSEDGQTQEEPQSCRLHFCTIKLERFWNKNRIGCEMLESDSNSI